MNDFTASNGVVVREKFGLDNRAYLIGRAPIDDSQFPGESTEVTASAAGIVALREFFRAEEDKRLGRWRYNDHIVVYSKVQNPGQVDGRGCTVLDEHGPRVYDRWEKTTATMVDFSEIGNAARAYFDAHPEPKPWHDAQTGEFWELWLNDSTVRLKAVAGARDAQRGFNAEHGAFYALDDSSISHAEKVWPGVTS